MPVARTSLCEALEEGRAAYSGAARPVVVPGRPAAVPDPEPAPTLHALPSLGGAKGLWKGLCALPEAAEGSCSQMAAEGQRPQCILLSGLPESSACYSCAYSQCFSSQFKSPQHF